MIKATKACVFGHSGFLFLPFFEALCLGFSGFRHAKKTCNTVFLIINATDQGWVNYMLHFGWEIHMIVSIDSLSGGHRAMDPGCYLLIVSSEGLR